jgi:general secretion pathway protein G
MRPSKSRRKRGFTMIEVLLVLVILVILASLAVVNIMSAKKVANLSSAKTQIGLLNDAVETYAVMIGQYPSQASGLSALRVRPNDIEDQSKWNPVLDKDIPADPWGRPYQYRNPGVHNMDRFDVYTTTPEGQEIGNWTEQK